MPSESRILVALLKSIKFFQDRRMNDRDMLETSYGLRHKHFKPGERVVQQGQKGDTFFIIIRGRCSVWKTVPADQNYIIAAQLYDSAITEEDVEF